MHLIKSIFSKAVLFFLSGFFVLIFFNVVFSKLKKTINNETAQQTLLDNHAIYYQLQLSRLGLKKVVFDKAIEGWNVLHQTLKVSDLLSIADLSQSSNAKRLYVIDIKSKILLYQTYVAHGRNSGEEFANSFSNKPNSYQTSLGFYLTGNTYEGKHGLSLQLKGLEAGINDHAEKRAIVIHGADYVSESFIRQVGRLGRSLGCPAIPVELCHPIINSIKSGSCFFIYSPDQHYLQASKLLLNI